MLRFFHACFLILKRENVCAYVLALIVGLAEDAVIGVKGEYRHGALEIDFYVPVEGGKGAFHPQAGAGEVCRADVGKLEIEDNKFEMHARA